MSGDVEKVTCPECSGSSRVLGGGSTPSQRYCPTCDGGGEVTPETAQRYHREQAKDALEALNGRHLLEFAQQTNGIEPRASLFVQAEREEVEHEHE